MTGVLSTRDSRAAVSVLPAGEIRNEKASFILVFLAKPKNNAEAFAKSYELSVYGVMQ